MGTWVWEGCALAGLSHLQPLPHQRMAASQTGCRQNRDLEVKNSKDGKVQSWA